MSENSQWQVIEGPDGQQFEFPASMSDAEISAVMRKEYPQTQPQNDIAQMANMLIAQKVAPPVSFLPEKMQSRIGSGIQGALKGGTFGFSDEIVGAGTALLGGDYSEARDQVRTQQAAAQEANPGSFLAGEVVGGLATGGTGAARTGVGMGGAIGGGLYGAGSADGDLRDRDWETRF